MEILSTDVKGLSVDLNESGSGDSCSIELDNNRLKYKINDNDLRMGEGYRVLGGYKGEEVNLFSGAIFAPTVTKGKVPRSLSLQLLERTGFVEKLNLYFVDYWGERIDFIVGKIAQIFGFTGITFELVSLPNVIPIRYKGVFDGTDVIANGDWSYAVSYFGKTAGTGLFSVLKEFINYFGGQLYINADGKLVLEKIYTKEIPDITYTEAQIVEYSRSIASRESVYSAWGVDGGQIPNSSLVGLIETGPTICLGFTPFNPAVAIVQGSPKQEEMKFVADKLKDYIGATYNYQTSAPYTQLTYPYRNFYDRNTVRVFSIIDIPIKLPGVPKGFAQWKFKNPGLKNELMEVTTDLSINILCWDEDKVTISVGVPASITRGSTKWMYAILVHGKKLQSFDVTIEGGNYYANVYDTTVSDYFGFVNQHTISVDYLQSYVDCLKVAENLKLMDKFRQYPTTAIVPFNPLLERGDLIRLVTLEEGNIDFYVDTIKHTFFNGFKSTSITGFGRSDVPWLGVGFGSGGAIAPWNTLQNIYGTWDGLP